MKMSEESFREFVSDNAGYCSKCDDVTEYGVEPDARGYRCPTCGNNAVMGIEEALLMGKIEIKFTEKVEE